MLTYVFVAVSSAWVCLQVYAARKNVKAQQKREEVWNSISEEAC